MRRNKYDSRYEKLEIFRVNYFIVLLVITVGMLLKTLAN